MCCDCKQPALPCDGWWRCPCARVGHAFEGAGALPIPFVCFLHLKWLSPSSPHSQVSAFMEHAGAVTALAIYRDDAHVVSASRDRSFMCWDLRKERRVSAHTQRVGGINDLCLSRDQSLVLTVGQERKLQLWDLRESAPVQSVSPVAGPTGEALTVAAAHSKDVVVTGGSDGIVRFWDLRNPGRSLAECVGHSGPVLKAVWSADDHQVVSCGGDGSVLLWNFFG